MQNLKCQKTKKKLFEKKIENWFSDCAFDWSLSECLEKMASQFRQSIFSFDMDMDADVHESPKKIKAGKNYWMKNLSPSWNSIQSYRFPTCFLHSQLIHHWMNIYYILLSSGECYYTYYIILYCAVWRHVAWIGSIWRHCGLLSISSMPHEIASHSHS